MRYSRIESCVKICMAKKLMLTCLSVRKRLFLHQVISNTTMSNKF